MPTFAPDTLVSAAARARNYPGRLGLAFCHIAKLVTNYVSGISPAPLGSITNDQLAGTAGTASPGALGLSQVATVVYDFTVNGGAISTIPLGVLLPSGSLVWAVTMQVVTAPTSAGSTGTIKLVLPTDGDLTALVTANGSAVNLNTVASTVPKAATALRNLSVTIATTALTAGKLRFFVHYVQSAQAPLIPSLINALMGASSSYEVLAGSTVTNTGTTAVTGDLGVSPGTAVTGFPPGTITGGSSHSNDASAIAAQVALASAYASVAALAPTAGPFGVSDIGGTTKGPGVYNYSSSLAITGTLTLDAGGNTGAQFVFQVGTTLTTATSAQVLLINGATAANVIFQVGSSATLGTSTVFRGNILANTSITCVTSTSITGKLLAISGAVTLDTNTATS